MDFGICIGPLCFAFSGSDINKNLANSTYYTKSTCPLSPHGQALSTVLTAIVGSVVGGLSGGFFTAFFTAWISWLAIFRILAVGIWAILETVRLKPLEGGSQFFDFWKPLRGLKGFDDPFFREDAISNSPTFLGWAGWIYQTIYAPVTQVLWIVAYWNIAPGSLKLVRALGVSVTALPLTIDTRARYGEALGNLLGRWARCAFNIITAASCLTLGCISGILFILAVIDLHISWLIIICYILLSLFWMYASFAFQIPHDESRSTNSIPSVLAGLAMGCFGACFLAAPAFILLMNAPKSPGVGLKTYLSCESVAVWHKFVAICP